MRRTPSPRPHSSILQREAAGIFPSEKQLQARGVQGAQEPRRIWARGRANFKLPVTFSPAVADGETQPPPAPEEVSSD